MMKLFALVSFIVIARSFTGCDSASVQDGAVCRTKLCKELAKKYLDRINSSVDPCEDFYEYSCGKWTAKQKGGAISEFSTVSKSVKKDGIGILNGTIKPKGPAFESEIKAKKYYQQCVDRRNIEQNRAAPVIDFLDKSMGGWPVISPKWDSSRFDAQQVLVDNFFHGSQPLFYISIMPNVENPKVNLIQLDSPKLYYKISDLIKDKTTSKSFVKLYPKIILLATKLLLRDANVVTPSGSEELLNKTVQEIIETERYLISHMFNANDDKNDTFRLRKFTLKDFQAQNSFKSSIMRSMTRILQLMASVAEVPTDITDDTIIIVPNSGFWPKLDGKLLELEEQGDEGVRRLANFIGWQFIYRALLSGLLPNDYNKIIVAKPDMEQTCLKVIKEAMPLALSALYVRDVDPSDLREKVTPLVKAVKQGFRDMLKGAVWMDKTTNRIAIEKLDAVKENIAYPDFMKNNLSYIDKEYELVSLKPSFPDSFFQVARSTAIRRLRRLTERNSDDIPIEDPHTGDPSKDFSEVNAYYEGRLNTISVLGGLLHSPFFDAAAPQFLNFAGAGFLIGHELTHGFDYTGGLYDKEGAMRWWWSNTTATKYRLRVNGIVAQYNKYSMSTGKVDGELTKNENIADNGGAKAALRGYIGYLVNSSISEPYLPGLEHYTRLQMFFISVAQAWCSKMGPEDERVMLLMDAHGPSRWRVNGALSNVPEFGQNFHCPIGSKMNPKVKNGLW